MSKEINIIAGRGNSPEEQYYHYEHLDGNKFLGELTFFPNESGDGYRIGVMNTIQPGGVGKRYARKIVEILGRGTPIELTEVIEINTLEKLHELGILNKVRETKKKVTISETNVLEALKMVRVLKGGGIKINKVIIEYDSEIDYFEENKLNYVNVSMFGNT